MEGQQGRQLTLADKIVDIKDDVGNVWYADDTKIYLRLASGNHPRLLGKFYNKTFFCQRKPEHVFKINNSYGFCIGVLEQLNPEFIEVYDNNGIYRFPMDTLRQYGDYLHFKAEGFEKQIFLPIAIIEKWRYTPEEDKRQKELLGEGWFERIGNQFKEDYMIRLGKFLKERREIINVFPPRESMFKAFKLTPYESIKVVIVGQDPYYTKGVADGLAFSVATPTYIPPSLKIIFSTIEQEIHNGLQLEQNPNLERWAIQGVFLLNTVLTVEQGLPKSHYNEGWEKFTSKVLLELKTHPHGLVVLLWGAEAKKLRPFIEDDRHLILEAEHPAAAARNDRVWENGNCFLKCNEFLNKLRLGEIEW